MVAAVYATGAVSTLAPHADRRPEWRAADPGSRQLSPNYPNLDLRLPLTYANSPLADARQCPCGTRRD